MTTTRAGDLATVPPPGQLHHTLLEREHELDALTRALERARAGAGALVVMRGEGGLGKSDLLATVREQAGRAGLTVLAARGDELEHDFPFGVALQLFEGLLRDAAPEQRAALLEGGATLAGALVDHAVHARAAWMPGEPGTTGTAPAAELGLVHGLYWLTANLAARLRVDRIGQLGRGSGQRAIGEPRRHAGGRTPVTLMPVRRRSCRRAVR